MAMATRQGDSHVSRHRTGWSTITNTLTLSNVCQTESYVLSVSQYFNEDTVTYMSEAHNTASWLDQVMCTMFAHKLVADVTVMYEHITSDHNPMNIVINFPFVSTDTVNDCVASKKHHIRWDTIMAEDL